MSSDSFEALLSVSFFSLFLSLRLTEELRTQTRRLWRAEKRITCEVDDIQKNEQLFPKCLIKWYKPRQKQSFGRTLINRILNQHPSGKGAMARIKQTDELKKKKKENLISVRFCNILSTFTHTFSSVLLGSTHLQHEIKNSP